MKTKGKYLEHIGDRLRVNFRCLADILVLSSCMCLCLCLCVCVCAHVWEHLCASPYCELSFFFHLGIGGGGTVTLV
jgi:hypothetical protein